MSVELTEFEVLREMTVKNYLVACNTMFTDISEECTASIFRTEE
jgi:hypothetical protein